MADATLVVRPRLVLRLMAFGTIVGQAFEVLPICVALVALKCCVFAYQGDGMSKHSFPPRGVIVAVALATGLLDAVRADVAGLALVGGIDLPLSVAFDAARHRKDPGLLRHVVVGYYSAMAAKAIHIGRAMNECGARFVTSLAFGLDNLNRRFDKRLRLESSGMNQLLVAISTLLVMFAVGNSNGCLAYYFRPGVFWMAFQATGIANNGVKLVLLSGRLDDQVSGGVDLQGSVSNKPGWCVALDA
ncbi:MAG: hypothetical protein Q7O66_17045 [Dehalococcoidia bacterium]|nr:hypothetical protein [Dehalococcoidia bacterium]